MTGLLLSLLLNASTAVAGPYADLEQAGWSLEAGHAETALARALAIADAHPALHDAASLLAARNELIEARLKHIDLQGLEAIARTRLHLAYGEAK